MASFGVLGVLAITMGLDPGGEPASVQACELQMDFVAGISHELRTPLAVSSTADNIAHGVVEDKQQLVRYGNTIVKQSRQYSAGGTGVAVRCHTAAARSPMSLAG